MLHLLSSHQVAKGALAEEIWQTRSGETGPRNPMLSPHRATVSTLDTKGKPKNLQYQGFSGAKIGDFCLSLISRACM